MKEKKYILAFDQGTTSSRAIVFDKSFNIVGLGQYEFPQIFPQPGYVEHDPMEILNSQMKAAKTAIKKARISAKEIAAIGITNQRETTIAWQRSTGKPVYNAIVWQCRRGAQICEQLIAEGEKDYIKQTTGLIIDAYSSASKMKWLYDNVPEVKELSDKGDLCYGTIDTWLIWHLTGGKVYATDVSNACRTMLYDINKLDWDEKLLKRMCVTKESLPEVKDCAADFGVTEKSLFGCEIPIRGVAGDQQAAMFGQNCFDEGFAKVTYGTGCFILMNVGSKPPTTETKLLGTIGWKVGDELVYALEGSAFNCGSAIKWLQNEVHMIETPQQADRWAEEVEDSHGLCFVPAFTGLGAPHWDMYARATLLGVTRGSTNKHIARAVLESIAMQSRDLVVTMVQDSGVDIKELRVDGGVSNSRFVMQLQSDILGIPVLRPKCVETTAMGAAMLAAIGCGIYKSTDELRSVWALGNKFEPAMDEADVAEKVKFWEKAIERASSWVEAE